MASIAGVDISVVSLAFENKHREITDNIFAQVPLLEYLRSEGNVSILDGGERINFPVMHATNSTAQSYSAYSILDTTPQEGFGNVEYLWRQYSVSVSISGRERRQVSGEFAIASLLDAKQMQAEMALSDKINTDSFAAQSGANLDGLLSLVSITPSSGTVGGIDRAAQTWWRNQQNSGASTTSAFDNLLKKMRTTFNQCTAASRRYGSPDFIITTRTVFEGYEGLVDSQRHYGNEKLLNLGFTNLAFKTAGVLFDNAAPTGDMFMINSKTLYFVMHQDAQMTPTEFVKPANQDAHVAQILFQGNLIARNSATNGVVNLIT